jgi:hypothetical protein
MTPVSFPRLDEQLLATPVYLWDHFYFTAVSRDTLEHARELSLRVASVSRGRRTRLLSEHADLVGKVGELVVEQFLSAYLEEPFESFVTAINQCGGDLYDFRSRGLSIDVKTRQLHGDVTIAPSFDLRVSEDEVQKYQDIYLLAGYCPETQYAYLFGWATWDEVQCRPIRTDIRCPAKCVPLIDLHPMLTLPEYLRCRQAS